MSRDILIAGVLVMAVLLAMALDPGIARPGAPGPASAAVRGVEDPPGRPVILPPCRAAAWLPRLEICAAGAGGRP